MLRKKELPTTILIKQSLTEADQHGYSLYGTNQRAIIGILFMVNNPHGIRTCILEAIMQLAHSTVYETCVELAKLNIIERQYSRNRLVWRLKDDKNKL